MANIKQLRRLTTGVPGLDTVLAGGLFESGVYIVEGPPGAGKTILANQICFHQVAQQRRAVYYTLLTESHDRMLGFLQSMSFFQPTAVPHGVSYVSGFKLLEAEGLPGVIRSIREIAGSQKPAVLVVDGLVSAEEVAPSDTVFKKFIHEIQTISSMFRITVLLLTNTESARRLQAEHTMVDGIIQLRSEIHQLKPQRSIEVLKFRGAGQLRGTHTLEISRDGTTVLPRIEMLLGGQLELTRSAPERRGFAIAELDAMLGGGLPARSNTMVLGPSGSGKTVLGLSFVAAGVAAGENALYFTFYEQENELVSKASRLGMPQVADAVGRGQLEIAWQSSVEANLDRIGKNLLDAFDRIQPGRVFIDGIHGFQVTADPPDRIQDFFAALTDHFLARGATVVFSAESPDLIGEVAIHPPFRNASRMCQNILLLRFSELCGRMARVGAVIKMRDSDFDPRLREVNIGPRGFEIGAPVGDMDMLLGGQPRRAGSRSARGSGT